MASKAPRVSVTISADASSYTAAVNKAKAQIVEFSNVAKRASHTTITDVQAISGGLRTLDGGIQNNIRSAERYLATLKGVGEAAKAIYPAIGFVAVGAVIYRGITALNEFIKKTQEAGEKFRASFQEMANSSRLSNDELEKTNINLENQIAKLTGKHENVLASELIDARLQADKLADSAAAAQKSIKALLDENKVGLFSSLFGNASTTETFGNIQNFQNLKQQASQRKSDALHVGDQAGADKAQADYEQTLTNEIAYYQRQIADRSKKQYVTHHVSTGPGSPGYDIQSEDKDQSKNITGLRGAMDVAYGERDQIDEQNQNVKDTKRLKEAENAKAAQEQSRQAQERARQAQEQAARQMRQQFEADFAAQQQDHQMSINEQLDYWRKSLDAIKGGSTPMLALRTEVNKKLAELANENRKNLARFQGEHETGLKTESSLPKDAGEQTKREVEDARQAAIAAAQSEEAYQSSFIALQQSTGQISKLDAAQQLATAHAKSLAEEIDAVNQHKAFWETAPDTPDRTKQIDQDNNALSALALRSTLQQQQDAASVSQETGVGALKESLDLYVQQSEDTASQVREIWSSSFAAVNDQFIKMMTERHSGGWTREWRNVGSGIAKNVAGVGLQRAEGSVLGAFGIKGKADGSISNPFHVIVAGMLSGVTGGAKALADTAGSVANGLAGGATSTSKAVSSVTGGLIGNIAKVAGGLFGGFFADGGAVGANVPIVVGEQGPEMFMPKSAGTVIPNHGLGGTHIHLGGVDARGAGDPAAIEAVVNRAFSLHAPKMIAASLQAHKEMSARRPTTSQK